LLAGPLGLEQLSEAFEAMDFICRLRPKQFHPLELDPEAWLSSRWNDKPDQQIYQQLVTWLVHP
jgi:hypothetical protein